MKLALLATAVVAAGVGLSMREAVAGTPTMWVALGIPYLVLGALAIHRLYDDGTLLDVLRPRAGDLSLGFIIGAALLGGAWGVQRFLLAGGSTRAAWLLRIALQAGSFRPTPAIIATIVGIALLEELVWRSLVLGSLSESLGSRRAWPVSALLYAAAHLPSCWTLADPLVGPNPLLVIAALGCGLVWGFAMTLFGRLPPVMISHAVFSYFVATALLPRLS